MEGTKRGIGENMRTGEKGKCKKKCERDKFVMKDNIRKGEKEDFKKRGEKSVEK